MAVYTVPATAPPSDSGDTDASSDDASESDAPLPLEINLTDLGNARRFARHYKHSVRYSFPLKKWYVWDGARWAPDALGRVMQRAKYTVGRMYVEGKSRSSRVEREALAAWALQSEDRARLQAMVTLAQDEPGIPILPEQLDRDPWLFNVLNGTLDLRTGLLRRHRKADLLSMVAPIVYDPEATAPLWTAFLERVLPDPAVRDYVQRAAGYSMVGVTGEQILLVLWGAGRNGKSKFREALLYCMGDYGKNVGSETFLNRKPGSQTNDLARLRGVRYVCASDPDEGKRLAIGLVKSMTGEDTLTVRFLYAEPFDFIPQFTPWLATNHKPIIPTATDPIWDRLKLVPFTVWIPPDERDKTLGVKLQGEAAGILNWLLAGCMAWQERGLSEAPAVRAATAAYRDESDMVGLFLDEHSTPASSASTNKQALYHAYVAWCEQTGEHPLRNQVFNERMAERGYVEGRKHGGQKVWKGLLLVVGGPTPKQGEQENTGEHNHQQSRPTRKEGQKDGMTIHSPSPFTAPPMTVTTHDPHPNGVATPLSVGLRARLGGTHGRQ